MPGGADGGWEEEEVSLSLPPLHVVSSLWSCALGVGRSVESGELLNYGWR